MIHLIDQYYLDSDGNSLILKKKTNSVDKNGEVVFNSEGYYVTVEGVLKSLRRTYQRRIIKNNDLSLSEAYEKFKALDKRFEDKIKISN